MCKSRGVNQRMVAAECLSISTAQWSADIVNSKQDLFKPAISKLLSDASSDVRVFARLTVKYLKTTNPPLADEIIRPLDERTKKAIDSEEGTLSPRPESAIPVVKKPKKPKAKPKPIEEHPINDPSPRESESRSSSRSTHSESPAKKFVVQQKAPITRPYRAETPKKATKLPIKRLPLPLKPELTKTNEESESRASKRASSVRPAPKPRPLTNQRQPPPSPPRQIKQTTAKPPHPVAKQASQVKPKSPPPQSVHRQQQKVPAAPSSPKQKVPPSSTQAENKKASPPTQSAAQKPKSTAQPKIRPIEFNGDEKAYLNSVKAAVSGGNVMDLQDQIPSIATHVLKCCLSGTPEISKQALNVLSELLRPFSPIFTSALTKLMTLLLRIAQGPIQQNAKIARKILSDLPSLFDATDLVESLMEQPPSIELLQLAAILSKQSPLSDEKLCLRLLHMSFVATKSMEVAERHSAGEISLNVYVNNRPAFDRFVQDLSATDRQAFDSFTTTYIPALRKQDCFECPKYTEKNYAKWLQEVENACSVYCDTHEWSEISGAVYDELGNVILSRSDPSKALILAHKLVKKYGGIGFPKLFSYLLYLPDSKGKDSVIAAVIASIEPQELCTGLQSLIDDSDETLSAAALNTFARYVANTKLDNVEAIQNTLGRCLSRAINSAHALVRKKAVLAFVEFKLRSESYADAHLQLLTAQQQKLVAIYFNRRCEK